MPAPDGKITPIPQGMIARVRNGFRGFRDGVRGESWFGPDDPQSPTAPAGSDRQWDYPIGYNLQTTPRDTENVSFDHLRRLAESYDVLRLAIETRKDQLARMTWEIRPRETKGDGRRVVSGGRRSDAITEFLRYPDKEHTWATWLRSMLEDLFVMDAPVILPRRTVGGAPYALELIDGSTIRRVIDDKGRTPMHPEVAYQQIIKGVVAADFSFDELIYAPRNVRTNKIYGFSPVEQIVTTVNVAIRRQISTLQYYTEGNVPEALANVPETWSVEQIKQFQTYWDMLVEGNTAARRHMKFLPGGVKYQPTRETVLKDEYDEWLARVVCYAFSLPPTAFIKQMNRATAETSNLSSLEEGVEPLKLFIKDIMDSIIHRFFDSPDLEFTWRYEASLDRLRQAQIHQIYTNTGIITANEARAEIGMAPMTPRQITEMQERTEALAPPQQQEVAPSRADPKNSTD